jgi:hypothetical protein
VARGPDIFNTSPRFEGEKIYPSCFGLMCKPDAAVQLAVCERNNYRFPLSSLSPLGCCGSIITHAIHARQ